MHLVFFSLSYGCRIIGPVGFCLVLIDVVTLNLDGLLTHDSCLLPYMVLSLIGHGEELKKKIAAAVSNHLIMCTTFFHVKVYGFRGIISK